MSMAFSLVMRISDFVLIQQLIFPSHMRTEALKSFSGPFGFLQALDDGKSVDDILGSDCEEPIFMVNPLVMRFCLWLLTTEFFGSRKDYL